MLHFKDEWRTKKRKVKSTIFKFFLNENVRYDVKVIFNLYNTIFITVYILLKLFQCVFEISRPTKLRFIIILMNLKNILIGI